MPGKSYPTAESDVGKENLPKDGGDQKGHEDAMISVSHTCLGELAVVVKPRDAVVTQRIMFCAQGPLNLQTRKRSRNHEKEVRMTKVQQTSYATGVAVELVREPVFLGEPDDGLLALLHSCLSEDFGLGGGEHLVGHRDGNGKDHRQNGVDPAKLIHDVCGGKKEVITLHTRKEEKKKKKGLTGSKGRKTCGQDEDPHCREVEPEEKGVPVGDLWVGPEVESEAVENVEEDKGHRDRVHVLVRGHDVQGHRECQEGCPEENVLLDFL